MLADSHNTVEHSNPEDGHLYSHHQENHNFTTLEDSEHDLIPKKG
jgi:hypothetical protein